MLSCNCRADKGREGGREGEGLPSATSVTVTEKRRLRQFYGFNGLTSADICENFAKISSGKPPQDRTLIQQPVGKEGGDL